MAEVHSGFRVQGSSSSSHHDIRKIAAPGVVTTTAEATGNVFWLPSMAILRIQVVRTELLDATELSTCGTLSTRRSV